jgi:quercetin dioxygenase-like cupin family protein
MIQYAAMPLHDWKLLEEEQLNPMMTRKAFHAETMTVARLFLRKYAVVPDHSHVNEQITMLESGALKFVIDGEEQVLRAGEMMQIPPHAVHRVEALEDSVAIDLFSPCRDDWKRGDDAYLRKPAANPPSR